MNADQMKKDIGRRLLLRPRPQRPPRERPIWGAGVSAKSTVPYETNAVPVDSEWVVDAVTTKDVMLVCPSTGHRVTLGFDNIREYRTPNFLMLKCQLILEGPQVRVEPL